MDTPPADGLLARLHVLGEKHGLTGLGVCPVEPFSAVREEMERRLASGESGRRRFTYTDPEIATDIRRTYPWAERLLVGSISYVPAAGRPGPPAADTGRIARFATSDHYRPLRAALAQLATHLAGAGFRAEVLADDNRLVDRAAAVRAGLAWWGKSTMALAPRYGPWLLLGSVVTDAALAASEPMVRDCGTCTACIPACPTGALDVEGVLDATLCISYWAQTPGNIPTEVRDAWGDRFYGCDECLDACPPGQRWEAEATSHAGRVNLLEVLAATDEELIAEFAHFYIPRRDARFLRRNALVALGHSGSLAAVPTIARYLRSPQPLLRAHAAWALGRIGAEAASEALRDAQAGELDAEVLGEIEQALGMLGAGRKPPVP